MGRALVSRYLRRHREHGNVCPDVSGGAHNVKLDENALCILKDLVDDQPDRTLQDLPDLLEEKTGVRVALSTVIRLLVNLGIYRKKKTMVASERDSRRVQELRLVFLDRQTGFNPERLVFIYKTCTHIGMPRRYGRGPKGKRFGYTALRNYRKIIMVIGALSISSLNVVMTVNRGTSASVFLPFVEKVLFDSVGPGDIVSLANPGAHRDARVREAIRRFGVKIVFLPLYSPALTSREPSLSKTKEYLRSFKARTRQALDESAEHVAKMST